jgi:hypothetical protein
VFPEFVQQDGEPDEQGRYLLSVQSSRFIPMLVQAVQELSARVYALEHPQQAPA